MVEGQPIFQQALQRLTARRAKAGAAAVLAVAFVVFAQLAPQLALAGLAGVVIWAGLWPLDEDVPAPARRSSDANDDPDEPRQTAGSVFKTIMEALLDPALLLNQRGEVLLANAAATALFPFVAGGHVSQGSRAPELLAALERAVTQSAPQAFQIRTNSPVERHLTGLISPLGLETADGWARENSMSLLVVIRDQTADDRLTRMRSDFVANASHELRTPLASIKGFIETLQGAAKDDPAARERFLIIMHEQAERMSRLIDDLLSLSRIEMRQHLAPAETVDLAAVVDEVTATLVALARDAGMTIKTECETRPINVTGDRDELAQVLQNLMQNAIRYGRAKGTVTVRLSQRGRRVTLAVADEGIGIAPEHVPRLTERFYRVNARDSRERGGTGLGLAIVKHIVNRHRGELKIDSRHGEGSTFTVIMPAGDDVQ